MHKLHMASSLAHGLIKDMTWRRHWPWSTTGCLKKNDKILKTQNFYITFIFKDLILVWSEVHFIAVLVIPTVSSYPANFRRSELFSKTYVFYRPYFWLFHRIWKKHQHYVLCYKMRNNYDGKVVEPIMESGNMWLVDTIERLP